MLHIIYSPITVTLIFLSVFFAAVKRLGRYSVSDGLVSVRKSDPYACGQRIARTYASPDYSQFFPYAFLFTIMHVLVLVIATAPDEAAVMSVVFVLIGLFSLYIVFRRN